MTRNLRKRHLVIWLVLGVAMIFWLAYATNHKPDFAGDQPNTSQTR